MSTADCKELLVEEYPSTKAKEWKRTSKFINPWDQEIRVFVHPVIGTVFVEEEDGAIITEAERFEVQQKSALTVSDFYFSIDSSHDAGDQIQVFIYLKKYFDMHGHIDSVHVGNVVKPFFPKDLEFDEEMESCFAIYSIQDTEVLKQKFLDSGFTHHALFDGEQQ